MRKLSMDIDYEEKALFSLHMMAVREWERKCPMARVVNGWERAKKIEAETSIFISAGESVSSKDEIIENILDALTDEADDTGFVRMFTIGRMLTEDGINTSENIQLLKSLLADSGIKIILN